MPGHTVHQRPPEPHLFPLPQNGYASLSASSHSTQILRIPQTPPWWLQLQSFSSHAELLFLSHKFLSFCSALSSVFLDFPVSLQASRRQELYRQAQRLQLGIVITAQALSPLCFFLLPVFAGLQYAEGGWPTRAFLYWIVIEIINQKINLLSYVLNMNVWSYHFGS